MSIHKTTPKTTLSEYLFATLFKERKKLGKLMEGGNKILCHHKALHICTTCQFQMQSWICRFENPTLCGEHNRTEPRRISSEVEM